MSGAGFPNQVSHLPQCDVRHTAGFEPKCGCLKMGALEGQPDIVRHDGVDMGGGAIDGGKAGVGFAEDEVEVGAGEDDGFHAVAPAQRLRQLPQPRLVLGRSLPLSRQLQIDAMDLVDLVVLRADDVEGIERAEQPAVDRELGAEQGNARQPPLAQALAR